LALVFALCSVAGGVANADDRLAATAQAMEVQLGAEIGLAVYRSGDGTWSLYKANQRFPMASTFKVLACAALLASDVPDAATLRVEALQDHSPVTKGLINQAVSPYQMCEATMRTSDNTAANLVLEAIGGPQAVTQFVRGLGDTVTLLDRQEPELNQGIPGDPRDTTTPRAMAETLHRLVLGDGLAAPDQGVLAEWLKANDVGGPLLRAGIPQDWTIGDRTGAGGHGTRGVVAVMWPPGRSPIVAAIYMTGTEASMDKRNAAIAALGRVIAELETTP
jgi:beta-lactamase class A/beta-lactamase class A CARB-5